MTNYTILLKEGEAWKVVGTKEAASAKAAIRAQLNGKAAGMSTGTFVAVPSRSWEPVTVKVEQALKFS